MLYLLFFLTLAQIRATVPSEPVTPAWNKGIQAINQEKYWNAVECGKQGGARPPCVFYDADLCKNPDFTLALFTPYKLVAHEVWQAAQKKQPVPATSFGAAQRTRITIGVTPAKGSKNPIAALTIKRAGKVIQPSTQSVDATGGRFIFDFAPFAPTTGITLEMAGKAATRTCVIDRDVLATLR